MNRKFKIADSPISATFLRRSPDELEIICGEVSSLVCHKESGRRLILTTESRRFRTVSARSKDRIYVWLDGRVHELQEIEETSDSSNHSANRDDIRAPMPGMIIKLGAAVGDEVKADQIIAVLEAMKMEHNLRAPRDGKISAVDVAVGQTVSADAPLVHLEPL